MKADPISKSSKQDTPTVSASHLDKELNDGLLALSKALEVHANQLTENIVRLIESYEKRNPVGPLMDVTDRLDVLSIGLHRMQQQIQQEELRKISVPEEESPTDQLAN